MEWTKGNIVIPSLLYGRDIFLDDFLNVSSIPNEIYCVLRNYNKTSLNGNRFKSMYDFCIIYYKDFIVANKLLKYLTIR
ncbi:MAG: hypothetical protein SVR08_11230, partial [Spirochaetota bacterium]|nr:hypothetical protein [Spirochaetota bacterium]